MSLVLSRRVSGAHLIIMRCSNEYDRSFSRDVESTAWTDFSEEDVGNCPPKEQSGVVNKVVVLYVLF